MTFKNKEEKIDQEDMVEDGNGRVCIQVEWWGWRRGRESKITKFLSLGNFQDKIYIDSYKKFANTCLLLGEEELRFLHF